MPSSIRAQHAGHLRGGRNAGYVKPSRIQPGILPRQVQRLVKPSCSLFPKRLETLDLLWCPPEWQQYANDRGRNPR
jgi:hypothetical protein